MKYFITVCAAAVLMAVTAMLPGCNEQITGGPCQYRNFEGTATVRTVTSDDSSGRTCENSVVIVFDFAPDDSSDVDLYRFKAWPDTGRVFEMVGGNSIPEGWAEKEGLIPGSEHRCVRREIRIGTCSPLIFVFPDLDTTDWQDYCDAPAR